MNPKEVMPKEEAALEVERIRTDFPILRRRMRGHPLVYLDNAATSQKPQVVIDTVRDFYETGYANVHRGLYELSEKATRAYEQARITAQRFLNARESSEIVFLRSTTEAVNLVASSFARPQLEEGDEILVTEMEHHSNIVPWQLVAGEKQARLRVIPFTDAGEIDLDRVASLFTPRTRLLAVVHISNALGTVNPVAELVQIAHRHGVPVLVDGAQAAPRRPLDVQALDCDFYAFSGHKAYGPTGIGVLYGKLEHLRSMPPYHGGGEMIHAVSFEGTTYAEPPARFEAGTPNVAGVIGLGAALEYLNRLGLERIARHEAELIAYALERLATIPGVRWIGSPRNRSGVISFNLEGVHAHDLGTILDNEGIAIRAGHHCAQPVMDHYGVAATARISFGCYNNRADVDAAVAALARARDVLA